MEEDVNQKMGTSAEIRQAFKGWDPRLVNFLSYLTNETDVTPRIDKMLEYVDSVLEWRLYTAEPVDHWTHPSMKFCLIGDSAHAMTPYLAQGAAMGIEDAAILGGVLEAFPNSNELPKSLRMYEKLRIKRTAMVANNSIDSRWFTQMEDGPEQQKRDEYLLAHPGIWENHINIRSRKEFLDELFGYDAYKALKNEIAADKRSAYSNEELKERPASALDTGTVSA